MATWKNVGLYVILFLVGFAKLYQYNIMKRQSWKEPPLAAILPYYAAYD